MSQPMNITSVVFTQAVKLWERPTESIPGVGASGPFKITLQPPFLRVAQHGKVPRYVPLSLVRLVSTDEPVEILVQAPAKPAPAAKAKPGKIAPPVYESADELGAEALDDEDLGEDGDEDNTTDDVQQDDEDVPAKPVDMRAAEKLMAAEGLSLNEALSKLRTGVETSSKRAAMAPATTPRKAAKKPAKKKAVRG